MSETGRLEMNFTYVPSYETATGRWIWNGSSRGRQDPAASTFFAYDR